ncbi:MAG: DUF354 domain-containing protein [Candidatus Odinarchaeota archaeon]|nr:DUF354 domain-containing protein [Candidatus Odinarchaeota archaeon]
MKKVWIDLLTPKQAIFFKRLIEELEEEGLEVIKTARDYRELNGVLSLHGIKALIFGRHGGRSLYNKLIESSKRILQLANFISKEMPDVTVSFSSPEAARVSFGLGIPHVCVSDSPHSIAVSKLTIPLSRKLITSKFIPLKEWLKFGIKKEDVVRYKAIDQYAWIKDFKPDPKVLERLGLGIDEDIVVIREIESFASYVNSEELKSLEIAKEIVNKMADVKIIVVPRYEEQIFRMKRLLKVLGKKNIIVLDRVEDTTSLIYFSKLFIGRGGTMNGEAALLGVPNVSNFPKDLYILKYLERVGLTKRLMGMKEIVDYATVVLSEDDVRKSMEKRAKKVMTSMEDPLKVIRREVLSLIDGS